MSVPNVTGCVNGYACSSTILTNVSQATAIAVVVVVVVGGRVVVVVVGTAVVVVVAVQYIISVMVHDSTWNTHPSSAVTSVKYHPSGIQSH